jgi:histone H3/H4
MGIFKKVDSWGVRKTEVVLMLVVKAKIKEYTGEYNVAGDFADALHAKVEVMIKDAIKRAEGNGRKTVMAKDL